MPKFAANLTTMFSELEPKIGSWQRLELVLKQSNSCSL